MFHKSVVCCYLYPISKYGYPPPAKDTIKFLQEMKAIGFQAVELEGIRKEHLLKVYELRSEIAAASRDLELSVPYFCIVLPGLASPDRLEREQNLKLFEKGCEVAELLGARGVLDNGPLPPYRFPDNIPVVRHYHEDVLQVATLPPDLNWRTYWQDLVHTYQVACDIAGARNLTYQMHPCLGVLSAGTDAFLYFHDAVARDNLRFNFDTANQFYLKDNLVISLHRLSAFIDYIHVSDNRGVRVEHLEPGEGAVNWGSFFETLDVIQFKGHIGLDIGGDETDISNFEDAYTRSAIWLERQWLK